MKKFFLLFEKMSHLNLVLSGSTENYAGLVYQRSNHNTYIANFSKLNLIRQDSVNPEFEWANLTQIPAVLSLVNQQRVPGSPLPLENGVSWYLALECDRKYGKEYLPLKIINKQMQFVDENPDISDTVRVFVPTGLNLKTNDVETRFFVRIGDELLIDKISISLSCPKLYLSPYIKPIKLSETFSSCDPSSSSSFSEEECSSFDTSFECSHFEKHSRHSNYSNHSSYSYSSDPSCTSDYTSSNLYSHSPILKEDYDKKFKEDYNKRLKEHSRKKERSHSPHEHRIQTQKHYRPISSSFSSLNPSSNSSSYSTSHSTSSSSCLYASSDSVSKKYGYHRKSKGGSLRSSDVHEKSNPQSVYIFFDKTNQKEFNSEKGENEEKENKEEKGENEEEEKGEKGKKEEKGYECPTSYPAPNPNVKILLIGPACIPDCRGKKCNQSDGCGKICGCPNGKRCNQITGECEDIIPQPLCPPGCACGSLNGTCEGVCPPGFTCVRDEFGRARCVKISDRRFWFWWIIGGIIIFIIFILIIFAIYRTRRDECYEVVVCHTPPPRPQIVCNIPRC